MIVVILFYFMDEDYIFTGILFMEKILTVKNVSEIAFLLLVSSKMYYYIFITCFVKTKKYQIKCVL